MSTPTEQIVGIQPPENSPSPTTQDTPTPNWFTKASNAAKSFIFDLTASVTDDKIKNIDQYQSERKKAMETLPRVQAALAEVPKTLEQFRIQPDSDSKSRALQGVYDYVAQLKQAEAQLVGLAQPRTQAQLLEKRLNTIIQAYDQKVEKGVMPEWYTDRNYEDHELGLFKRVQKAITDFKGAYQAQEILSSSGVDKELGLPIAPDPADEEVNGVISSVEYALSNTVGRLWGATKNLALGLGPTAFLPMTDRALSQQAPLTEALINERDAALAKGDSETASAISGQIMAAKVRQKALNSAHHLVMAKEILLSTPSELKKIKDSEMNPSFYQEAIYNNLGEESPTYSFFKPINKALDTLKGSNKTDLDFASKAGVVLESVRAQPPVYDKQEPRFMKSKGDQFELPPQSKQEQLHEQIDGALNRVAIRNAAINMIETDVTKLPEFIADFAAQGPAFEGVVGGAKLLSGVGKAFSKEALLAGRAAAVAKYGDTASMVNKFDTALQVINGEKKLLEIPTIQAIYTTFGNKIKGLAGGDEALYNTVKDLKAQAGPAYDGFITQLADLHKAHPEATSRAGQKLTQTGLTIIDDSINREGIAIGESIKRLVNQDSGKAAMYRLQKEAKEATTAVINDLRAAGYKVEKSDITSPRIVKKRDGTSAIQLPHKWRSDLDEAGKFELIMHEWGHSLQVASPKNHPAYMAWKMADQEMLKLARPMGFVAESGNRVVPARLQKALESLDAKEQLNARIILNRMPQYQAAKIAMEDEAHQIAFKNFGSFTTPGSRLSQELPSIKQARAAALGTYQNTAEVLASPETLIKYRSQLSAKPNFSVGNANQEFLEKSAKERWMKEYQATGFDVRRTSHNLGINIDDIDYTKLANDEVYLRGMDILRKTGKDKAIVEGIINHPELNFPEGNRVAIKGYLDFYEKLGYINKESGAVDLVYYGYSPRDIKQSQSLMQALLRDKRPASLQVGKGRKFPTFGDMEQTYSRLGYELNSMSLEVAASYANKTAANISVSKFRSFIKESQGLEPDKFPEAIKKLEKYIATGRPFETDRGTQLWNRYVMTPMKRSLLTGFPATQVRNIADDAFRASLANGATTQKASSLREAFHAYNGTATERITLGAGHSYTGEELSKIMANLGVTKSEIVAGDGITTAGARLVRRKIAGPVQKGARAAWEASPFAPELSMHTNNVQRANVFIHEMRDLLKKGTPFQEAAWSARNKVGTYLIDYADTSLATDFVADYIPFFRFYGQSLNTMIDVAMQKPWAFGRLNTLLFNSSFKAPSEEERKYLTPYLKEMTLMSMGHDKLGNRQYLSQLGLSYEIINQFFTPNDMSRNIEKWASQAPVFQFLYGIIGDRHPFFGTPYNSYMGRKGEKLVYEMSKRSEWFNKAIGGMTSFPDGKDPAGKQVLRYEYNDPKRAYILLGPVLTVSSIAAYNVLKGFAGETAGAILSGQMSPRGMTTWSKLTDPNKENVIKLLNYMTGLKFISVDENAGRLGTELSKLSEQAQILMSAQRKLLDVASKWSSPEDQALYERTLKELRSKTAQDLEEIEKY